MSSPVWHPFTQHGLGEEIPTIVRAEGAVLHAADGRSFIDAISSWWVTTHGHGHPLIMQAIAEQAQRLDQIIFAGWTHEPAEAVACVGLVAINGFDHFVTVDGEEGVAPRVLDRMIARFPVDPAGTVADFRKRCGDTSPFGDPDPLHLGLGLELLRDADERARSRQWTGPLLSLQGGNDPILPKPLRDRAFARAPRVIVEHVEKAGHLMSVTHAPYCADRVRAMVQDL